MSHISFLDYYLPKTEINIVDFLEIIPIESIPKCFENIDEYGFFINDILNLKSVRIEEKLTSCEMIEETLDKIFSSNIITPDQIDLIVFVPEADNKDRKNLPQYIQQKYKMKNASVINIAGNHCVNIEIALSICKALLITNNDILNILIISASKSTSMSGRIVGTYGIYGDAAGVILVSNRNEGIKLVDTVSLSYGELCDENLDQDNSLAHCRYTIKALNKIILKNNLHKDSIDKIIIHNANPLLIKQCLNSKGLGESKIFINNLGKYGHLNQLDFIVNLKDLISESAGNKLNILTFGSGWSGSYVASFMTT